MLNWWHESPLNFIGTYQIQLVCRTLTQQPTWTAKTMGTVFIYSQNSLGIIIEITDFDIKHGIDMDNKWFTVGTEFTTEAPIRV